MDWDRNVKFIKLYQEVYVLWIGSMPPLISGGDRYCEGVYNLEQFGFVVSKKMIFVCSVGNHGVIYCSDVKVCRQNCVHDGDAMHWSMQSFWSILQYDVCPLGMRSRFTPEFDVLPIAISPAVMHRIRLSLVCTTARWILCCFIRITAVCVVVQSCYCCHIYVRCVTKNELVS